MERMPAHDGRDLPKHMQKVCILWHHNESFSRDEVIFNGDRFPEGAIKAGVLSQMVAFRDTAAVRDHTNSIDHRLRNIIAKDQSDGDARKLAASHSAHASHSDHDPTLMEKGVRPFYGPKDLDEATRFIFVPKEATAEQKSKGSSMQVE
jgi:DEP domain-containing protein 5